MPKKSGSRRKNLPKGFGGQRFHFNTGDTSLKYLFATFIESVAAAAVLEPGEQALHCLDPRNQRLELRKFSLGQFMPPFGRSGFAAKAKKQFTDFIQSETGLSCSLDHGEPVEDCGVVAPLPAGSLSRRKYSDLFVIANSGRPKSNLSRHLRNE